MCPPMERQGEPSSEEPSMLEPQLAGSEKPELHPPKSEDPEDWYRYLRELDQYEDDASIHENVERKIRCLLRYNPIIEEDDLL